MAKLVVKSGTLLGIGIGGLFVIGAAAWVKQTLFPGEPEPCTKRYHASLSFPRQEAGAPPLDARAMQTGLGYDEHGLLENVSIKHETASPGLLTLSVRIPAGSLDPKTEDGPKGGVSYTWKSGMPATTAVGCLAYEVFLPKDFAFHQGGDLPGIFGGEPASEGPDGFSTSLHWHPDRKAQISVTGPAPSGGRETHRTLTRKGWTFETDRWVRFEQEVMLNTPGEPDGVVRLWADGKLVAEETAVLFRKSVRTGISGVAVRAHYSGKDASYAAPADTTIYMTPVDMRWW
jgi:hypothetical protein